MALSTKERSKLKPSQFVFKKDRRYPIQNVNQARIALRMVEAHGNEYEKSKVKHEVYKKYPSLKKR